MRVVFDTSVIVAAVRSRSGASNALLLTLPASQITPLATTALFIEYEEVLKRPEQRLRSGLSVPMIDAFLSDLAGMIEPVEPRYSWRPQLRDMDDEMVLEAAVNGRASLLVTHNIRDFRLVTPRFGIETVTPGEVLERLRR